MENVEGLDSRHERGCVSRYGATNNGQRHTDAEAAACACHRPTPSPAAASPLEQATACVLTAVSDERLALLRSYFAHVAKTYESSERAADVVLVIDELRRHRSAIWRSIEGEHRFRPVAFNNEHCSVCGCQEHVPVHGWEYHAPHSPATAASAATEGEG